MNSPSAHQAISHYSHQTEPMYRMHPTHQKLALVFEKYMFVVAMMMAVVPFLQASLMLQNETSENVSIPSLILMIVATTSILCYAVLWRDWLLALSGLVSSVGWIFALVSALSFRPAASPKPFQI